MIAGKPTRAIATSRDASDWSAGVSPGTTGTPASIISRRAPIFEPMRSSDDAGGPTNTRPAASHALAKCARSDRNP